MSQQNLRSLNRGRIGYTVGCLLVALALVAIGACTDPVSIEEKPERTITRVLELCGVPALPDSAGVTPAQEGPVDAC